MAANSDSTTTPTQITTSTPPPASDYARLLEKKMSVVIPVGIDVSPSDINPILFPFQRDIVRWALKKGRCAIWADTGLGKTFMQVEWARHIAGNVIIVAPLAVTQQTIAEAEKIGVTVRYCRHQSEVTPGITITNYEMIEHFDAAQFAAVVLDESSILKSLDGVTRKTLTTMFNETPYRLCCTATPAPNDVTEIGRHSEFLGVMSNAEMLSAFFINSLKQKDGTYRLKKHAVNKFYQWLAAWAMAVKKPSDLGYSDEGYSLPALNVELLAVDADGMLPGFHAEISAIEAKRIRRMTIEDRITAIAPMVSGSTEQWVIWCGLNDEADALAKAIPGAVDLRGSMTPEEKARITFAFAHGDIRVLITKTSITGFGVNWQNCHNTAFFGMDYSWEAYYQAVRRFYRFGQQKPVNVYVVTSNQERSVFDAVLNKEKEAVAMTDELVKRAAEYERAELAGVTINDYVYQTGEAHGHNWRMMLGDSCERISELGENSIDLSVFSPPFISLYTYTPTERDMGNSRNDEEFFAQFQFIIDGLLRATKPGRNCCVHVQQIALTKINDGVIGIHDFRGDVIRQYVKSGWTFHGEVTIDKNPQVQAIRTKTKGLMFAQLHKDSAANRPAFADYLLIFQKPGENAVQVKPDVTNEEWIEWAHPVWYDIKESDVLNAAVARSNEDERHICPLQLGLIERAIRLWTNAGETVFDPFAGIGSTGHEAVRLGRQFVGIELKPEYFNTAVKNLKRAEILKAQVTLFDLIDAVNG
jgi:DNA modification methylase/superfamily II DNA or RNA helicase